MNRAAKHGLPKLTITVETRRQVLRAILWIVIPFLTHGLVKFCVVRDLPPAIDVRKKPPEPLWIRIVVPLLSGNPLQEMPGTLRGIVGYAHYIGRGDLSTAGGPTEELVDLVLLEEAALLASFVEHPLERGLCQAALFFRIAAAYVGMSAGEPQLLETCMLVGGIRAEQIGLEAGAMLVDRNGVAHVVDGRIIRRKRHGAKIPDETEGTDGVPNTDKVDTDVRFLGERRLESISARKPFGDGQAPVVVCENRPGQA